MIFDKRKIEVKEFFLRCHIPPISTINFTNPIISLYRHELYFGNRKISEPFLYRYMDTVKW